MKLVKVLFLLLFTVGWSQDQHESQNWQYLKGRLSKIIFKKGQEKEAQKIANIIDYIHRNNFKSMEKNYEPIDIILRSKTVESNGFVTVSPFRSEFFNTAPTTFNSLGTTDWISTLSIHEYRHVQQFLNHKNGLTQFFHTLIGETGWGLFSLMAVPNWYFEGDAVVMETALTQSGRGRLPKFTSLQRANALENQFYSYSKTRNGSYKDLVPNHYAVGYQMLNYFRNHYDASQIDDIARKAASYRFPLYPFTYQLKKETGLSTKKLYQKTVENTSKNWSIQRENFKTKADTSVTKNNKTVTSYGFPQIMDNGKLIVLKSSYQEIPTFYSIDSKGNEQKIAPFLTSIDNYFNYKNELLTYTGYSLNARYNFSSYNDVYVHNLATKSRKKISHNKRYFSPSFNNDASKIVTVENNEGKCKLVVLNSTNGAILNTIDVEGFISRPKFIDRNSFVYLKQLNNKLSIFKIDADLKETQLLPWTSHSMDNIQVYNKQIFFSASFSGIDNIYAFDLNNPSKIYKATNTHIGAYQAFVKDKLYYTEPNSKGNRIATTKLSLVPYTYKEPVEMDWNNNKTVDFEEGTILEKVPNTKFTTYSYNNSLSDLKFHDWSYSANEQEINASVVATTLLNDFSLLASTNIYLNEVGSYGGSATLSYKKLFPILNLGVKYNKREFKNTVQGIRGVESYHDFSIYPSITIPLNQIKGNYSNSLSVNGGFEYKNIYNRKFIENETETQFTAKDIPNKLARFQVSATSIRRKAKQHINSRAGISTFTTYYKGLNSNIDGKYFSTENYLFLPGIFKSHNSFLKFAYQKNEINQEDTFRYARGYKSVIANEVSNLSYTYQLPILYPDFGFLGITYFKRIRANLFMDYSQLKTTNTSKYNQHSTGFEIVFDNTYLNISHAEIGIGYRGSFLLEKDLLAPNNKFVSHIFIATTLF